jgi:hypothetical protein
MGRNVIDLRSPAVQQFDEQMDGLKQEINQQRKLYRDLKGMGVPESHVRMRALKQSADNFDLEFDMRKRGVGGEELQSVKASLLEGGGSVLMSIFDVIQRGNFAVAGSIEEGLNMIAPEGTKEGELLDSIYNRARITEQVAAASGQPVRLAGIAAGAHRMWEILSDDDDRGTLAKVMRNAFAVASSGAVDEIIGTRIANELFSGLGDLKGQKKTFGEIADERDLAEGPSISEVLKGRFGAASFENPFHHEIEIPTAEGPRKIAHDGVFTRLFGGHIGFHEDGSGILALEKDGLLDFRTSDLDLFAADVLLDPTTYVTAGSAGIVKAGGRPLAKAGINRLVAHEAAEQVSRKAARETLETAGDEIGLQALRRAHSFMTPREVAERLVIEEARRDPALFARGGEIRFMGQKIGAIGTKPGEQTRLARIGAERRIEKVFSQFRKQLLTGSTGQEVGNLRPMLESIGATGRRLTQFLRAEETANPEWLAAWARSEGGSLTKMRLLDNDLKATGIRPRSSEAEAMIESVSDPLLPRSIPGMTPGQKLLMRANDEVDAVYAKLSQEAIVPANRQRIQDLTAMLTMDHRYGYARRLRQRLADVEAIAPDSNDLPRTEVFVRNPDKHIDAYLERLSATLPFTRVDQFTQTIASHARQGVRRETEMATQPLYNELFDIWQLRTQPGLNKTQQRQAQALWRKRVSELRQAEKNRAELLLAKGDRGAFITPLSRQDLKEIMTDIKKSNPELPKLHWVDDPVEHVRRRGQVAYQKEGQSYLIQKAQQLAKDDAFARNQIETNLVGVGSLQHHPNASLERVGRAVDVYDEAVTPKIERGVKKEVVERVPLGKERMPVIDTKLEELSDEAINEVAVRTRGRLDELADVGPNSSIRQQVKRARAEDEANAARHEIIRRQARQLNTNQKARELAKLDLENPFDKAKALLVLRAAKDTDTLNDLQRVLRGLERDPRFLAVDIQDQFDGLARLADEIKTAGRVAIDMNPENQIQKWERQVVFRNVLQPSGRPMTKALAELKTKEDMALFFRQWLFGEDRFAKRWAPGTVSHRFWEAMQIFNDVPDFAEGSAKIANFVKESGLKGDEAQAMRQWLDEAMALRGHLKEKGLDIKDILPPASLRGELAPDGTKFRAFGGIVFDRGRWRLTTDNKGPRVYLPESIVRQLIRMGEEGIRNPEVGNFAKAFDTAQNMIKFNLTVLGYPAFQVRNWISNNVYAFTAAGLNFLNPVDMTRAGQLAWRASDPSIAFFKNGHRNSMRMLVMQDVASGLEHNAPASLRTIADRIRRLYTRAPGRKRFAAVANEIATDPGKLRKEAERIKEQLDMEWFRDDLGRVYTQGDILREIPKQRVDVDPRLLSEFVGDTPMREILNDPRRLEQWRKNMRDKLLRSNAFFEQWTRQQLFMTYLRRGTGFEEAGRLANKWLLDYARLSPTEKTVMKRIFPFYTFYRKTVPLMVESLYTRPGVTSLQAKMMREPEDPVISFGTSAGERIVVQRNSDTYVVGGIDLPIKTLKFLDTLQTFLPGKDRDQQLAAKEGWKEIMLLSHPLIHTALGMGTDFEVFQGRRVEQRKMDAVGLLMERSFGADHPMFKNGTIRKTEGRDGLQHYYFDTPAMRLLIQGTGLSRIVNRSDQMVRTVHELDDGQLTTAIRFMSGIAPRKLDGGQAELEKVHAVAEALENEAVRRGIHRRGEHIFEIREVPPNPLLD